MQPISKTLFKLVAILFLAVCSASLPSALAETAPSAEPPPSATPAPSAPEASKQAPTFQNDVLPVFMRHGCNAGDCHGAASGKDGFMLSLFGYDVPGDFYRLTEEIPGRRLDLAAPEDSLLLQKSIGAVAHSGGELFKKDHADYQVLKEWIRAGALRDPEDTPVAESIRVEPSVLEFASPKEAAQSTRVIATYSDGSERDVTHWSLFLSSNEGVAVIDEAGAVRANRAGGAHVFARFNRFTEGAEVFILPGKDDFKWSPPAPANYIDQHVYTKLEKLRIHPSPLASDEHFLRRVTLDLAGTLPTVEEYHAFLADSSDTKRAKKIDELLARDAFADIWTTKWSEWLRLRTDTNVGLGTAPKAGVKYHAWIREQFREDRPIGEFFHALLTGTGSTYNNPPANFYTMLPQANNIDPSILSQDIARVTLGIQTGCAECHNHPFDRWTMDDYYQWASFFTGIRRKVGRSSEEMLISADVEAAPIPHLLHGEPASHRFLGGEAPDVKGKDARKVLADWLTAPANTLFRENIANRTWEHFFGRGIVEPVDDIRVSNPPSNGPLLKELGRRLAEDHGYTLRSLVRDICNSTTYQLSASTLPSNAGDAEFFSHASLRRPRADILFDSFNAAMGNTPRIRGTLETRAISLREGNRGDSFNNYFFTTFGQAKRESTCACETVNSATLSQSLHLINGRTLRSALERSSKLISNLQVEHPEKQAEPEAALASAKTIINHLFIRSLTRKPTPVEMEAILEGRPEKWYNPRDARRYYEGVLWAVLNSSEFLLNH